VTALSYCGLVAVIAAVAIISLNGNQKAKSTASLISKLLAEVLGLPKAIFTVVLIYALIVFHRNSALEIGVICAAWIFTGVMSPFEGLIVLFGKIKKGLYSDRQLTALATVAAYQTPGLVLVRVEDKSHLAPGSLVLLNDARSNNIVCLALSDVGRDEGLLIRLVELPRAECSEELKDLSKSLRPNEIAQIDSADVSMPAEYNGSIKAIIGIVAPESSIERLYFEVCNDDGLEEGKLVETMVSGAPTTYQIVNGLTKEEIVQQKSTHGFSRGQAQKIGRWDPESAKFVTSKWIPAPNAPVVLVQSAAHIPTKEAVGHFPGTSYPATIKSIHELVTHNTAILGILGVGKSMLAIELVERMISSRIKVICLDLTDQYAFELKDFYDEATEHVCIEKIELAAGEDIDAWNEDPEQGGSLPNLRSAVAEDLKEFLNSENKSMLKIYNPAKLVGSKQLTEAKSYNVGGAWKRGAVLWSMTPVEFTRLVTEEVLACVQDKMSTEARVCLVYEEAHSLVPEFSAVASPGDREATNGTARAILQGRKFGMGCLLVTQRTANVTKTILNQCNTVFAMRTFDETGKDFLANYVGKEYAASLSSIPERHAVFFGKGSSCENPILIRLNDREEFRAVFRQP